MTEHRSLRSSPALVAAGLLVVAAMAVAYALGTRTRPTSLPDPLLVPEPIARVPAPLFSLPSLRGPERIALADFRGQVVVLNFFASWCAPCALEAADLRRTALANQDRGVMFLGIAVQDEEEAARAFLARHDVPFPAVIDRDGSVVQAYEVTGIPTTVFIDPDGRIAGRWAGMFVGDAGVARLQARIDAARARQR
jgi:peroxiredoxin